MPVSKRVKQIERTTEIYRFGQDTVQAGLPVTERLYVGLGSKVARTIEEVVDRLRPSFHQVILHDSVDECLLLELKFKEAIWTVIPCKIYHK